MTNKELLEDLLIEFDELGMEPTTIVPNPSERAIRWKRELIYAIEQRGAEVAREIFEELRRYIINHCYLADDDVDAIWKHIDKLKNKYMEAEPPKG